MNTTLPMDWPPLREAAEATADELHARLIAVSVELYGSARYKIGGPPPILTATHRAFLADLARPASRDFWARWLAEKMRMPAETTAPKWWKSQYYSVWCIASDGESVVFHEKGDSVIPSGRGVVVPGISAIIDPAEALRAALLAVVPHAE